PLGIPMRRPQTAPEPPDADLTSCVVGPCWAGSHLRLDVFEVNVPARWLRHSPRRGIWYVRRDIPPGRLRRLLHFNELAVSPLAVGMDFHRREDRNIGKPLSVAGTPPRRLVSPVLSGWRQKDFRAGRDQVDGGLSEILWGCYRGSSCSLWQGL